MAGFAKPLDLRLFLEGIEVPVVAAQVTIHTNGPAAASIQVVPLDEVLRLKPRTMVHLFFLEKPSHLDAETGKLENYRLLFAGEAIGFAWIQKANMRGVVLQCLDFSNYWDTAIATVMNYSAGGNALTNHAALSGANATTFDNIVNFVGQQLANWLKQRPETPGLQNVSGLAGGIIRALEAVSGIDNRHRGVNDFFTVGELRCKVLAQICAEENDTTAANVLAAGFFDDWITQNLQVLGEEVSFRQVILLLFRYIFYDFVPNPTAKYDPPTIGKKTDPKAKSARLKSHILRPDCWFAPPPRCNVFFPEFYTDLSYDRTFISEATRVMTQFHIKLVGANDLLDQRVVAPSIGKDVKLLTDADVADPLRQLMKHELHTGIIQRVERVPNTLAGIKAPGTTNGGSIAGVQLSWASKVSLFNFFKERFASRQASVSGRFNPYVVCGFPGLVIKRPFIAKGLSTAENNADQFILEQIQDSETAKELGAPSQILGMIHSVNHNLNQDGGSTTVSMNFVREHLAIDDEFLDVFSKTNSNIKKRVKTVLRLADLTDHPNLLKLLVASTPQLKVPPPPPITERSTEVAQVDQPKKTFNAATQTVETTTTSRSVLRTKEKKRISTANPYVKDGKIDGLDRDVKIPSSTNLIGRSGVLTTVMGIEVLDESISLLPDGRRAFGAVALYEDVTLPGSHSIAVEEIIRPNWFSPAYKNENIGDKIYQPFFGCSSIIENVQIQDGSTSIDTGVVEAQIDDTKSSILSRLQSIEAGKSSVSIERAVNLLSYLYGIVKENGLDVDEFVTQYTYRPIAGMADVIGYNVFLDVNGKKVTPGPAIEEEPFKVGFHTMAIHPTTASQGKLLGLLDDPTIALPRMNKTGVARPPPEAYDVRDQKYERVLAYFLALSENKAFRG